MNELCLEQCLTLIEEKLGWGSSEDWLNQDFQLLSDQIFDETRVRLSITTLKRVWGKVNYDSAPSISTLNTLAKFVGFDNWSAFKQNQGPIKKSAPGKPIRYSRFLVPAAALVILITAVVGLTGFDRNASPLPVGAEALAKVKFSSQPTSLSLPNSIVFNYDLSAIRSEKAYIQQSWNKRLTFEIDKNGSAATAIYYYPGYFRAKLVANDQILKEHDVHVKTDGWMGTIGTGSDKVPRYLYDEELDQNGVLKLSTDTYQAQHDLDIEKAETVNFHYSEDMGEVYGDDFIFETSFRNTYRKSNGICQFTEVMIHGSEGVFIIPAAIPGCVSDLDIFHVGYSIDGKSNDLSAFGTDFSDWQRLRCEANGNKIKIFLNNELVREIETQNELGRIVGLRYSFSGAGEVDFAKLSNNKKVFFEEDF